MKLTQRQKQILADVGLPTSYADLNDSQRNDIMAIEDMLCYMEDTYKTMAVYKNFTQASLVNDETLTVEMDGLNITVSRRYEKGQYIYEDNYMEMVATDDYETAIQSFFTHQGIEVKVYAEIYSLANNTDPILESAEASLFVFICGVRSRTEFEQLVADYGAWYMPQLKGVENATRFYMMNESDYLDIGKLTYYDCLQEVEQENRILCIISADGTLTMY